MRRFLLALMLFPSPAAAQRAESAVTRLRPAVMVKGYADSIFSIEERMRYWHVPGVSLAIIDSGRIVFARGFGVTEFGGHTPVDTTTLFLAGSISKPVFATGALALVEQGKLSLDADINSQLKSWRLPDSRYTEREKVTLRRLLTHTAGLTVWGFPGYQAGAPVPSVQQVLDGAGPANTAAVRNDTIPGARWLYSGGGYTIAQLLASDASGEPFAPLMQRLVLRPAGMLHSTYENPLPATRHHTAASGHERIDVPVAGRFHTYPEMAAAGLWTTAPDLARWALAVTVAYLGRTGGVVSPEMARQMISRQVTLANGGPGGSQWWGLGPAVGGSGDSVSFFHGGRDEGFVAMVSMWPRLGRGYVILTNGVSGPFLAEVGRAISEALALPHAARQQRSVIAMDSVEAAPLVGRYVAVPAQDTVLMDVSWRNGQLWMYTHVGKRVMQLRRASSDTLFDINAGTTFVFERDGHNPSPAFRFGNVRATRVGAR